jgi:hypothetical protein
MAAHTTLLFIATLIAAVVAQDPTTYITAYPSRSVVGAVPHLCPVPPSSSSLLYTTALFFVLVKYKSSVPLSVRQSKSAVNWEKNNPVSQFSWCDDQGVEARRST